MDNSRKAHSLDIVIPVYNEGATIQLLYNDLVHILAQLALKTTIYLINDGSADETGQILASLAESDPRVVVVDLSRNFGHQAALTAGLDLVTADVVITMDGDGEHPPSLIPRLIDLFELGYDIVNTQRMEEQNISYWKRQTSGWFYWLINRISDTNIIPRSSDFRLMSRQAAEGLRSMRENHRFLRGMISWMGYSTVIVPFPVHPRLGGKSKYSWRKMFRLAMDAIFSFSLVPLQIGLVLGLVFFLMALLEMTYVLSFWINGKQETLAPGWSSLMFVMLIVGGVLMALLGIIGLYVGYIFQEVKRRPPYIIRRVSGSSVQDQD